MTDERIEALKAIAHPLRYAILKVLAERETNVGDIETATGIAQPTLSQQLSVLRKAGLVGTRREAKLVFYQLEPDAFRTACEAVTNLLPATDKQDSGHSPDRRSHTGAAVFAQIDPR